MSRLENEEKPVDDLGELPNADIFHIQGSDYDNWYDQMLLFVTEGVFLDSMSKDKRKKLALKSTSFINIAGMLHKRGIDQVIRRCVPDFEQEIVLKEAH